VEAIMVYIIAEAGIAHEGSQENMEHLASTCFRAGADALKIQWFKKGLRGPGRELPWIGPDVIDDLISRCHEEETDFIITPHDEWAIEQIINNGWVLDAVKIGSGGWDLIPFAREIGPPLIISTGMKTQEEVSNLELRSDDTILHCISEYPCPAHRANIGYLYVLADMAYKAPTNWNIRIGYSDHCSGTAVALASLLIGEVIEKHITIEKNIEGKQDTWCALDREEFIQFVHDAHEVSSASISREKRPTMGEIETAKWLAQRLAN
jgi:N,N'-diacetyllegionaminate synthase